MLLYAAMLLLVTCGLRSKRKTSNLHSIVTKVSYLGAVVKTNIQHERNMFELFRLATKAEGF